MLQQEIAWKLTSALSDSTSQPYKPLDPYGHSEIIGIILSVILILIFALVYYFSVRKMAPDSVPTGYVLMVQLLVMSVRNFVVDLLGKRYEKFTPFFLFMLIYITVSNIIGIIGITPPTASLTVTMTLGLMMFFGMLSVALVHQRKSYVLSFFVKIKVHNIKIPVMPNPLAVVGEITPLLTISIRLWGNIFSGIILVALFYFGIDQLFALIPIPVLSGMLLSVFGGLLATFLHFYFDIAIGFIQGVVFFMLTVLYWSVRKGVRAGE